MSEAYLCGLANYAKFDLNIGDGIKMWILSQGSRIKVIAPLEFVRELKEEILTMSNFYDDIE